MSENSKEGKDKIFESVGKAGNLKPDETSTTKTSCTPAPKTAKKE